MKITNILKKNSPPQSFRDAKVSQFEELRGGHEDVLGLEVAVEDLVLVQVRQGESDLDEKVSDGFLVEILVRFHLSLDELLKNEYGS